MDSRQTLRPGPLRWIWYAMGGALGPRYREWVLRDVTCPSRWLRQIVRTEVQVIPLAVLLPVILGTNWITWFGVACGVVLALIYSVADFDQSADFRLIRHGYPSGTAEQVLSEREKAEHTDRMRRYMHTHRNNATCPGTRSRTPQPACFGISDFCRREIGTRPKLVVRDVDRSHICQ